MNAINLANLNATDFLAAGFDAIENAVSAMRSLSHEEIKAIASQINGVHMRQVRTSKRQAIEAIRERLIWRMARLERGEVIANAAK